MALNHAKLQGKRTRSGGTGWKPREGENHVRILPPTSDYFENPEDLEDLAVSYKIHFFRIEGRPTEVSRCLNDLPVRQKCPACDAWRSHRKSEDPGLKEMAKDISPSDQYLFNMIDLNNLPAGLQIWTSNWTCWDKIMEIGANPAWGDVVSPSEGVNFIVNKTPGNKTRTGYPSYSVMPDPNRTTIVPVLDEIDGWKETLDNIHSQISEAKSPEEIKSLLGEIGVPGYIVAGAVAGGGEAPPAAEPAGPAAVPGPGAPAPAPAAPAPAVPAPAATPAAAPVAVDQAAPAAVAPAAPAAVAPAAPETVEPAAPAPAAVAPAAVGSTDAEKGPKPECFGGYDPQIHPCPTCPWQAECQMQYLGLET